MVNPEIPSSDFYQTLFNRRDVRGQFSGEPVCPQALARVLYAAHHAPSVGFMQPWNFLVVQDRQVREQVHQLFQQAQQEAATQFSGAKRDLYGRLKLEGILESSLNICITCDRQRTGPVVLGRTHMKEMDLFSTVCAVQNFWLAARAEGLGVGWVSIFAADKLKQVLGIPEEIVPIAYLCVGPVSAFNQEPDLQTAGWQSRLPIEELVYFDQWQQGAGVGQTELLDALAEQRDFPDKFSAG